MTHRTADTLSPGSCGPMGRVHRELNPEGWTMIEFLAWWTGGAILLGSALSAWIAHLSYRAH